MSIKLVSVFSFVIVRRNAASGALNKVDDGIKMDTVRIFMAWTEAHKMMMGMAENVIMNILPRLLRK